ncbi:ABC transporter permease subunit [Salinibacterium sp. G-O1]|uniref:ABC transporter permease n=1 Tax=Salinibacterium sp. G-O1 TaxID=3046208 RepID=UPI0024B97303|nr:ABC transporter permease subunit [Salinibacterium sp. G-O1]MDJ0335528.1 ABC transporter permease subunit [Salinibacterium sp. G-O1]
MNAYLQFATKEAREIVYTWRIWVLPAIMLFFAISGPVVARFTPEIIGAVGGAGLDQLVLPSPTYLDAYSGWIKNLSQITLFAIIIIYGGIVSSELRSGTALLVLTKPVSRTAFVAVKAVVNCVFVSMLLGAGTLVTWAITAAIFGPAPPGPLWSSAAIWLVLAILFIAIMTFLSVVIGSAAGASGGGIGAFVLLSVAAIWTPLSDYSPAGLAVHAAALAAGASTPSLVWPVVTSLTVSLILVAGAAALFRRKEL